MAQLLDLSDRDFKIARIKLLRDNIERDIMKGTLLYLKIINIVIDISSITIYGTE